MNRFNVLVAEGRKLTREGLCALLHRRPDLRVVGEADDVAAAIKLIGPLDVRVVVLNIRPPAVRAGEAVQLVRAVHPQIGLVAIVSDSASWDVRPLLDAGVDGCVTKACTADELVTAVRLAARGERYVSPVLFNVLAHGVGAGRAPHSSLAPREVEVLRRIASGETTKEIAGHLDVGPKTVETHRRRIMAKLDRHSVAELTQYAILSDLITLEPHV